jgi:hypothetical protein
MTKCEKVEAGVRFSDYCRIDIGVCMCARACVRACALPFLNTW